MATKDERPGLLSKVAMFVRNPTKDWSELDQPTDSDGGGYDKQALKAMIERKRQNDFVRKREFDQLRKLRDRDPSTIASLARNSFFQNSLPSDLGGRAVTLKKIDEIEAQMSRQWWKSKSGTLGQTAPNAHGATTLPPGEAPQSYLQPSDSDLSAPFAVTEPVQFRRDGSDDNDEFIPTQMASDIHSVPGHDFVEGPSRANSEASFSTSRLFAIEVDSLEADPELEEGAIRFANSDDAGAEKSLLEALRGKDVDLQLAQSWVGALLDLYRATNNSYAFEVALQSFASVLEGVRPQWFALGDAESAAAASARAPVRIWESPAVLTAAGMESLRAAMVSSPMPWYLGWGALEHISADAVTLLDALFSSLCEEAVSLRFDGEDKLVRALRTLTPSGNREIPETGWHLRLNALRVMGLQDDFELAALDFCVTYGVAPPSWEEARCQFELHTEASNLEANSTQASTFEPTRLVGMPGTANAAQGLVLQGQIMGDALLALSALNGSPKGDQALVINCRDLVRVDFAAAGSILNWVTMRESEGVQVQFQDVHRLVAAFFNVIGINEHAKVILRAI